MTETLVLEGDILDSDDNVIVLAKKAITPKGLARLFVGSSVKFIVTSTIASLVPAESKLEKAKVLVGAYVISGVISEKAKDYITNDLDEKFEFCREVYAELQKRSDDADLPNS